MHARGCPYIIFLLITFSFLLTATPTHCRSRLRSRRRRCARRRSFVFPFFLALACGGVRRTCIDVECGFARQPRDGRQEKGRCLGLLGRLRGPVALLARANAAFRTASQRAASGAGASSRTPLASPMTVSTKKNAALGVMGGLMGQLRSCRKCHPQFVPKLPWHALDISYAQLGQGQACLQPQSRAKPCMTPRHLPHLAASTCIILW